jgi:hypothetical protein
MPAHVAYLGVDGILAARRHGQGVGTLPPFFNALRHCAASTC